MGANEKAEATFHPAPPDSDLEQICVECGNDLACEGYKYCSDCLELLFP